VWFTKVIRFYPEWPTCIAKEGDVVWTGSQFGLVCKDPLEMTGSFLACHSIRFSRFKPQRTARAFLRFCPLPSAKPFLAARRYIRCSHASCQQQIPRNPKQPLPMDSVRIHGHGKAPCHGLRRRKAKEQPP
jgi:hypothetical protein